MTRSSRTKKTSSSRARKATVHPKTPAPKPRPATKLDRLAALLARREGTSIVELTSATGWQPHSVRGALAGSLKRRGLAITSKKLDGVRRYKSGPAR